MSESLIPWLRAHAEWVQFRGPLDPALAAAMLGEAADKIESLEREVAELRSHGQGVNENPTGPHPVYRHIRTGRLYERVVDAIDEWTMDDVVCYRSVDDGEYWVRDAREFNDPKRFERIEGER